ncbi:excinuclease ABC subunit UvrC [Mycoplasmopsis iners]|uniref:excinuclease ABC subunit UvrC n=1 Tax=Mycoplasmopsis iners TaxID=76630 RepID=UPI000495A87A|nr:excinuclease ABC subunit UvrC [Mycoplasmopsis iners]
MTTAIKSNKSVLDKLKNVPGSPGIYLWKNHLGNVIYVGKAKNLKKRMSQYFEGALNSYKTTKLVDEIVDFDLFIVNNDKEALLLERQYIEKYNPIYNILLLDDKRYPYIKIELKSTGLEIGLSRKIKKQDHENLINFGPFPNGYGATTILKLLQREAFYENGLKVKGKNFDYWQNKFNEIKTILNFTNNHYLKELENKMLVAADNFQFEIAKDLRDSLKYLKKLNEKQVVELKNSKNLDVVAYKSENNILYLTILFYRYGILINKDNQNIPITVDEKHTFESFFEKYYQDKIIPSEIIVSESFINFQLENINPNFKFISPKIGIYKKILETAELNLAEFFKNENLLIQNKLLKSQNLLNKLKQYTNNIDLKNIVVFDNSNLNNTNPVGVAIVYSNGLKNKSAYRKYNHPISLNRQADVEYMKQSVFNYFSALDKNITPNLIIVDGGLQQVHEAKKTLRSLNLNIPIIGLVKDDRHRTRGLINLAEEEIKIKDQELFNFLAEIQIEVDRFAKEHLRKRQKITSLEGKLQKIKGLGDKMEQKLLLKFGTYNAIYNATLEELSEVVPKNIAEKIFNKEYLDN